MCPQFSFFFNAHNDFFEEIAKYRAARRIWHKAMVERYKSRIRAPGFALPHANRRCSLTAQQPYNNVVRTAIQALAAVLGGTQSFTEFPRRSLGLPTEFAATIALRTQQIIAHETGSPTPSIRSAAPTSSKLSPTKSNAAHGNISIESTPWAHGRRHRAQLSAHAKSPKPPTVTRWLWTKRKRSSSA